MQYSYLPKSHNCHSTPVRRLFCCLTLALSLPLVAMAEQPPHSDTPTLSPPAQTNQPHASLHPNSPLGGPALSDIQDRIDTIDQAGLHALLSRILNAPTETHSITRNSPHPLALLNRPEQYRGEPLCLSLFLHSHATTVHLGRTGTPVQHIFYVPAHIPFEKNRRMPAILLLLEPPVEIPSTLTHLEAFFYMILRVPTRQTDPTAGPTVLDYVVLVAQRLEASATTEPALQPDRHTFSWLSGAILVTLLAAWIALRRWTAHKAPTRPAAR